MIGSQTSRWRFLICSIALAGIIHGTTGCGGGSGRKPNAAEQATITGSLKNNGKNLPLDTSIVFESGEKTALGSGKVDALGKFSITAGDPGVGLPKGRYTVMVRPAVAPPVPVGSEAYKSAMMQGTAAKKAEVVSEIPKKFQDLQTSPLKLEVKAGANNFDIDLSQVSG